MRTYVLDVPFEMRAVASASGAKWDAQLKAFTYSAGALPPALQPFRSVDYSWERWIEDDLNKKVAPVQPGSVRFTPRPHQLEAGRKIDAFVQRGYRGFLEADEVGTGKSISCLLGAYSVAKRKGYSPEKPAYLLIVCPHSAMPHWRNTLRALSFTSSFRVVVINYERLSKLLEAPKTAESAKKAKTKKRQTATKGRPLVSWDAIIADESHKLKNYQEAQRAKAFTRVAQYATSARQSPFVIWASATAGQNPLEVGYLAPMIGQITRTSGLTTDTWGNFLERRGFHVKKGKSGWRWVSGNWQGTDLEEVRAKQRQDVVKIRELLFSPQSPTIRRLPEDIAGWPQIQRIPVPVDLDSHQQSLYKQVWSGFRNFLRMHPKGRDPQGALAQQLRFRQKASLLRVPGTIDFAADLLDNGQQVAISVAFMESLDAIREGLEKKGYSCVEFSGRNRDARENERLRYQRGQAQVILYSVTEAVSFHAGESLPDGTTASRARRSNVIHDVRYSSIENAQIEGRTHRDGQKSNAYYMYGVNTIEEKIITIMIQRMANMKNLSGDEESLVEEIESLLYQEAS